MGPAAACFVRYDVLMFDDAVKKLEELLEGMKVSWEVDSWKVKVIDELIELHLSFEYFSTWFLFYLIFF